MEIETNFSGGIERDILLGLLTDTRTLQSVVVAQGHSRQSLFRTKTANLISSWCFKFYDKYKRAPKSEIVGYFYDYQSQTQDKDLVRQVEKLLSTISDEFDTANINSDFIIDRASDYFNEVALEKMADKVKAAVSTGKVTDALEAWTSFQRFELGAQYGIDPLRNAEAIERAFSITSEPVIEFKDHEDVADFFNGLLCKDCFVSFVAREKLGKSTYLLDLAWRAMLRLKKVAFFEIGDMSESQVMVRLMCRALHRPRLAGGYKKPRKIIVENFEPTVEFDDRFHKTQLKADFAISKMQDLAERLGEQYFRLSVHPNGTVKVSMIESILAAWAMEGWIPDLVVIDYADLLEPENPRMDKRNQIDDSWKRLRGLSQKLHILVLTATQANAASYKTKILGMDNFSESKTKNAHITAMIGINASDNEINQGVRRLNVVASRDKAFNKNDCLYTAGMWAASEPMVITSYGSNR
jgi:replicative DNA helicase